MKEMSGLRKLCKVHGSIRVSSPTESGTWYWNHKTGEPYYVSDKDKTKPAARTKPAAGTVGSRKKKRKD